MGRKAGRRVKPAKLKYPDDQPTDWRLRSVLQISRGDWRMRNGHLARVDRAIALDAGGGKTFPVWFGKCVDCNEPKTWNINGTYAAVGLHPLDIVARA